MLLITPDQNTDAQINTQSNSIDSITQNNALDTDNKDFKHSTP